MKLLKVGSLKHIILISVFLIPIIFQTVPYILAAPVRGTQHDTWADIVLGKPNFEQASPNTVNNRGLFLPHGIFIDRRNPLDNKMYVFDAGNNRILGFDVEDCRASLTNPWNCDPVLVIGQPDFNSAGCNGDTNFQNYPVKPIPSASTICGQPADSLSITETDSGASMAVDADGNLYFPDYYNNRVLKYNDPFNTDTIADEVWGQNDFTGQFCNKGGSANATTLCFGYGDSNNWTVGVDIDPDGNLWVSDNQNNRVLRFPNDGLGNISKTADLVLGQTDFTSTSSGNTLDKFRDPTVVRVNSDGVVYVAERFNSRVLKFETVTTGATGEVFGSGFSEPAGLDFDDTEPGRIWVENFGRSVIELWDETSETLIRRVGRLDDGNMIGDGTGSIGFDSAGNLYVATGGGETNNAVLIFDKGEDPENYTHLLFVPDRDGNRKTQNGMGSSNGLVVSNGQLISTDLGRILFWNIPNGVNDLFTGKPPDGFIIASSFTDNNVPCCHNIEADETGHLYTSYGHDGINIPQLRVYDLPLTTGETHIKTLSYPFDVLGGGQVTANGSFVAFSGYVPTPDSSFIWVSDNSSNRVMRIRDPLGSNPVVDIILGQEDLTGDLPNQGGAKTPQTFRNPGYLSFDNFGNLYIADAWLESDGNNRIIQYNADSFPTDNATVMFGNEFTPDNIIDNLAIWKIGFDSSNRAVFGFNPYYNLTPPEIAPAQGRFAAFYESLLVPDPIPTQHLSDYSSGNQPVVFDEDNNLFVGDGSRGRILVYLQPFEDEVVEPPPPPPPPPPPSGGTPPPPPSGGQQIFPTLIFTANKYKVNKGEEITLQWTSTNLNNLAISPDIGTVPSSGTYNVRVDETTEFLIYGSGSYGSLQSTLTIEVIEPEPEPEEPVSYTMIPGDDLVISSTSGRRVKIGDKIQFFWRVVGADSVHINFLNSLASAEGSFEFYPTEDTEIVITATRGDITKTRTVKFSVYGLVTAGVGLFPEQVKILANTLPPAGLAAITGLGTLGTLAILFTASYGGIGLFNTVKAIFDTFMIFLGILPVKRRRGYVYETSTGNPVQFGQLALQGVGKNGYVTLSTIISDSKGAYYEPHLEGGNYTVVVSHPHFDFPTTRNRPTHLDITSFYKGEQVFIQSNKMGQAIIIPMNIAPEGKEVNSWRKVSFFSGRILSLFQWVIYPLFILSVIALLINFSLVTLLIAIPYTIYVALKLLPVLKQSSFKGQITASLANEPIENVVVVLRSGETLVAVERTDKNGRFKFRVPKGSYNIQFISENYTFGDQVDTVDQVQVLEKSLVRNYQLKKV